MRFDRRNSARDVKKLAGEVFRDLLENILLKFCAISVIRTIPSYRCV
jgi:hypothetical protein